MPRPAIATTEHYPELRSCARTLLLRMVGTDPEDVMRAIRAWVSSEACPPNTAAGLLQSPVISLSEPDHTAPRYTMLRVGEIIQTGDELQSAFNGHWTAVCGSVGSPVAGNSVVRRPVPSVPSVLVADASVATPGGEVGASALQRTANFAAAYGASADTVRRLADEATASGVSITTATQGAADALGDALTSGSDHILHAPRPVYRVLRTGEVVASGDQLFNGTWQHVPVEWVGRIVYNSTHVFRRYDENYVILPEGESLLPTDYRYDRVWETLFHTANCVVTLHAGNGTHCRYYANYVLQIPITCAAPGYARVHPVDTVREGDERWVPTDRTWVPATHSVGRQAGTCMVFRRRVAEPPAAHPRSWRYLEIGEAIAVEDYVVDGSSYSDLPVGEPCRVAGTIRRPIPRSTQAPMSIQGPPANPINLTLSVASHGRITDRAGHAGSTGSTATTQLPPVYRLLRRDEEPRPGDQYAPVIQFEPGVDETFHVFASMVRSDTVWKDIRESGLSVIGIARTRLLRRRETNYRVLELGEQVLPTDYVLPVSARALEAGITLRFAPDFGGLERAGTGTHFRFTSELVERPAPDRCEIVVHASQPGEDE